MKIIVLSCALLLLTLLASFTATAETSPAVLEKSMSDTLDLWRDGRFELLYDHLAHRGKTSREQFVNKMRNTSIKPACCFQKMENFRVLNEKRTEATVYVKVGLEGAPNMTDSSTREFKLTHEENIWKLQLKDVFALAGVTGKNTRHNTFRKHTAY